jgi:2-keto-3-deoxy-galactonokinase
LEGGSTIAATALGCWVLAETASIKGAVTGHGVLAAKPLAAVTAIEGLVPSGESDATVAAAAGLVPSIEGLVSVAAECLPACIPGLVAAVSRRRSPFSFSGDSSPGDLLTVNFEKFY